VRPGCCNVGACFISRWCDTGACYISWHLANDTQGYGPRITGAARIRNFALANPPLLPEVLLLALEVCLLPLQVVLLLVLMDVCLLPLQVPARHGDKHAG
jgi:hypothetical protein